MIPDSRQSQAVMLLQGVRERIKDPRVSSVLQCAIIGALAFDVMVLIVRLSDGSPLFGMAGLTAATAVGGIAGALVRYYFARKQEEAEDRAVLQKDPHADTVPTDLPIEPSSPIAATGERQASAPADPLTSQGATYEDTATEAELPDIPQQIEMWPSLREKDESQQPPQSEIPQEHLSTSDHTRQQQQGILPIEAQFLTWIMDSAQIFCVAVNAHDEIVMTNRFVLQSLGYAEEDIIGHGFTANLVPPRLRREAWIDALSASAGSEAGILVQSWLLSRDGQEIPVQWHGMAVSDEKGSLSYCLLMGFDLTEHKQLEEALVESQSQYMTLSEEAASREHRYRAILDSSVEATVLWDLQGNATYANAAFTALFGWTVDDLQSPETRFVPDAQRELEKPFLDALVEKGVPCKNLNTKRLSKDGRNVSVRLTASRVCDDAGLCTGMFMTMRELVERVKDGKEQLKPVSTPRKRQVNAKDIVQDIRAGATDLFLMEKYKLTAKGLNGVFQKLVQAKAIKASEIVRRSASYDETVAIAVSRIVPLERPKPQPETKKPERVSTPPARPVKTEVQSLDKFGLTEDNLEDLVKGLLPQDVKDTTSTEIVQDSSVSTQDLADVTARRAMPRHYMVVSVPIYESNNLLREGTIIDISEQGMKIQGIDTVKGETKSLLIQGDEFHDVFPFIFDAVCRWATSDEATGDCIAGFQITAISDTSIQELRKLISALSISS